MKKRRTYEYYRIVTNLGKDDEEFVSGALASVVEGRANLDRLYNALEEGKSLHLVRITNIEKLEK